MSRYKAFLPLLALVAGCARVPELGPRPQMATAPLTEARNALAPRAGVPVGTRWWTAFNDPQLTALVEQALAGAPDLAAAAARVRASQALVEQAGSARLPSVGLDGTAGVTRQSQNLGIPPQFVPDGVLTTGRLSATAAFNLDLWGRNRAALAAAQGEAEAATLDAAQARLLIASEVATAYVDLARAFVTRDLARQAVTARQQTVGLTEARVRGGLETQGPLAQAEQRAAAARADVAASEDLIALARNRLALLVGRGPDFGSALTQPTLTGAGFGVPDNAGIDLIGRRPDVTAARLRTESAAARIKVARADFYPNINLSALIGLQSLGLDRLINGGSVYGSAGPAISLPIFDGGRIEGRYRQSRAEFDQAVARYDQVLLTALREAADATAQLRGVEQQLTAQRQAASASADAARVARLRYQAGLSNQLPVLAAEDAQVAAQRAVAELEARRLVLQIGLARALGGGLTTEGR